MAGWLPSPGAAYQSAKSAAAGIVAPVRHVLSPALRYLPGWPWYVWAGLGVGTAVLLGGARGALAAAPPIPGATGPGPQPTIYKGSSGAAVSTWQAIVGAPATGVFDDATLAATKTWQTAHGLDADGVVGPMTWKAAGFAAAAAPAPAPAGPGTAPAPTPPEPSVPAPPPAPTQGNPFGLAPTVPEREGRILALVSQGQYDHLFTPLTWSAGGHTITALVSRRAFALSDGTNRLMISMSFKGTQKLADMLGAHMLTTRVADEIFKQAGTAIAIPNKSWNTDKPVTGGNTSRMYEQSNDVAAKVAAKGDTGLVANEGKDWVITRRFWVPPQGTGVESTEGKPGSRHNSANFGWYPGGSKTPGGLSVIQSVGLVHEKAFVDYSQLVRLMLPVVTVDGQSMTTAEVLADPALSYLLNDEGGTVPATRHPDL